MGVNQISNNDWYYSDKKQRDPVKELDKDAFLQIMVAQLRYQDPTSPMDSGKFIEQMAMFTSMEQMANLNTNMEKLYQLQEMNQASSLIGKQVSLYNGEELISGEVERVTKIVDSISIWVSGKPYDLSQVVAVERGVTNEPEKLPTDNTEPEQPTGDTSESEPAANEENGSDESSS